MGNEIGPQVVGECKDLLELLDGITHGFPAPRGITKQWLESCEVQRKAQKKTYRMVGRVCSGCGVDEAGGVDVKLNACSRCGVALYCGKECQTADWKRGHKLTCVKC